MKRIVAIAFAAALLCHVLLLFGFRAGDVARPLPLSDTPQTLEVALVAPPPEPPPLATPPPAQEPTPSVAPTPEPTPEPPPQPEPTPPPSEPEPTVAQPIPSPAPKPTVPPEHSTPRPSHPAKESASHKPAPRSEPSAAPAVSKRSLVSQWFHCWDSGSATTSQNARPRYRSNPLPRYPEEARRNGEQGVVLISAQVEANGHPSRVTLKQSSGFPLLDAAALEAVRKWTFDPARAGGLPAASRVDVPVRFALGTP